MFGNIFYRIKCGYCYETLPNQLMFYAHSYENHSDEIANEWISCRSCCQYFPSKRDLNLHLRSCSSAPGTTAPDMSIKEEAMSDGENEFDLMG